MTAMVRVREDCFWLRKMGRLPHVSREVVNNPSEKKSGSMKAITVC